MAGKTKTNWTSLRDDWINRRLAGEALQKKAFAAEKGVSYSTLRHNSKGWVAELKRREVALTSEVNEAADKTHKQHRQDLLDLADHGLRPILDSAIELWKLWTEKQIEALRPKIETGEITFLDKILPLKDICALVDRYEKVKVIGAGMPREHNGIHDEVPTKIRVGREQMEGLKGAVVGMAEWKRDRRK